MSLAIVYTRAALGIGAPLITIEVHISNGLPGLTMVGLPETTVREARDRVRSAIINSGYTWPAKKITINLAPADLPKEGGRYDLPIALALLVASEQLNATKLNQYEFVGELALTGALRGVPGAISSAMEAIKAGRKIIVSDENATEVGLIGGSDCLISGHLQEVCAFLEGINPLNFPIQEGECSNETLVDLRDVIGQQQGKRALEIIAAGGHNLLMIGPPGTGKTMLASRLPGLLPPLSNQEALESAAILSLVNSSHATKQWRCRPFRAPHHSASLAAMVGGGSIPAPGEISLAHNGILFLDELPEFERRVLDALREPIESGIIHISRTRAKIDYPARFQLIAAMNPSPTGHYQGQHNRTSPEQILRYLGRLSGPFLDRFDLSLEIPLPPPGVLSQGTNEEEGSASVRLRVLAARERQLSRQKKLNAHLGNNEMKVWCQLHKDDAMWLEQTLSQLGLSIRAWQRLLKVARTIADLEQVEHIKRYHLQEALGYRAIDRMLLHLQKLMA
ncbi:YifB family Mg chelatase-like AAA ATPase [Klebsiella sp. RHBSTW-00484]|uniref:YifB family Mg chelatase-like AAA ATPase n=1 Tax=unclassified Klebsiella TaxID=2608929 RepID=UPI0015E4CF14|nr:MULTISPECIES: YifB family Mg chelatase-like AAA ATPase [unclassified Klebsiella]MBA7844198.1 YifB family Mg chelatase-like AAA ATPase [Klebsiella sp. RHBSTW-00465]QLO39496.1 YifB family Mg chelatase-like AAA ATPase [Klebsiella sp. RHBSTW-00484]QLT79018.1 YifB family Mg chelatase-like AAA ATPase [Klebsiella sp. RHBSTW-00464]